MLNRSSFGLWFKFLASVFRLILRNSHVICHFDHNFLFYLGNILCVIRISTFLLDIWQMQKLIKLNLIHTHTKAWFVFSCCFYRLSLFFMLLILLNERHWVINSFRLIVFFTLTSHLFYLLVSGPLFIKNIFLISGYKICIELLLLPNDSCVSLALCETVFNWLILMLNIYINGINFWGGLVIGIRVLLRSCVVIICIITLLLSITIGVLNDLLGLELVRFHLAIFLISILEFTWYALIFHAL